MVPYVTYPVAASVTALQPQLLTGVQVFAPLELTGDQTRLS